jgi:TolB-like protein/Tfp pilus assembly protein PilF/tRNA A-37 threonylcarbamoyl transferase component Bud32
MTTERWQQIEKVFQTVLDFAEGGERERYLAEACAGDAELRGEVERLLVQHERAGSFISVAAIESGELPEMIDSEDDSMLDRRIGAYRLIREIGRGGMGAVYEAERADNSFQRRVAVKFVKRGMDTDLILKRFRNERQILASLNHPNIARLLDGGTTADGLPYFVMEFVAGEPLYAFCDRQKLSVSERLKLFLQICEAVEEAHRNKVIHRDLKPSNILVRADGTAKLLDFGIAKLLDPDMAAATIEPTATQMRLMTPEYASPEQVCGEPVTPAADVYSLGVLLYELVSGHRPYRFKNRAMHEISRVVCEQPPPPPSESLTREDNSISTGATEKATSAEILGARSSNLEALRRELAGNLDRVILKALGKAPAARYQTAIELAEDIRRVLEKRPVKAEPLAVLTGAQKAIKPEKNSIAILPFKHIGATETTGDGGEQFLGVGLADSIVMRLSNVRRFVVRPTSSVIQYEKLNEDAFQIGGELAVEFVVSGTIRRAGNRIRVSAQLLDIAGNSTQWAQSFDENLTDVLTLEDTISGKIAESLIPQLSGEERSRLEKRGTNNAEAYESYLRGRYFWNQFTPETFPKALESFEKAVALDPDYALAHVGIADFYNWATIFGMFSSQEGYEKTRAAVLRALELDDESGEAYAVLGFITAFSKFDWTEGERLFKRALELSPNYNLAHEWYGSLLAGIGRNDEAIRETWRSHELDPLSLRTKTLTAWHLYQLRQFPEALAKAEELIEMNPLYYQGFFQRGNVLTELGRAEEAVTDSRRGLQLSDRLGYMYYKLCFALMRLNRRDEAEQVVRDFEKIASSNNVDSYHLAMCYAALDDRDRAFEYFNRAVDDRSLWLVWLATEIKLDALRDDERFNDLLRKTNRPHLVRKNIAQKNAKSSARDRAKTFAVLPLKVHSITSATGEDDKFLGLGLTDALTSRLSKIRDIIVRPTASVMRFGETGDPFEAGRELEAGFVLDGNIRRVGDRVRVSVQLLNIETDSTHWAQAFDEKFTDILELEDTISAKVVESLAPHLTGEEQRKMSQRGTDSPEAYEAYLRGRFHWNQFTPESLPKALESFETAIALDSEYALPHVGVADFYIWANIYGLIPTAALDRAEVAARRAIALDERLGEAYASLGLIVQNRFRWAEAEKLKKQAIKLSPNYVNAHEWYGAQLVGLGRTEEGIKEIRITEGLDPLSLRAKTLAAWTLYQANQFDEALNRARQIIDLDKNYPQGYSQMGFALWGMGRVEEALPNFQKFDQMLPDFALAKYQLCFGLAAVNRLDEARAVLEEIKTLAANAYVKPYFLAMAHTAVGDLDRAFEYFEQSVAEFEPWLLWFATDPMLESLRNDHRYVSLLKRMNHPLAEQFVAKLPQKTSSETNAKSIAVLPLKFIGAAQPDDVYLGVGLADAMIARLSKVQRLVVRPTSSVLQFNETTDSFEAGRKLGVNFVLDGTIRRAGTRVRISAQLLDISGNATRWAESFDENLTNVLDLEDLVAEKVARLLIPKLTGEEHQKLAKRGTDNAEAYEAQLRGRYHLRLFTPDNFAIAKSYFEQATALDPNYAAAYIGLADCYFCLGTFAADSPLVCYRKSSEMAEKALALDATLGEANTILGFVKFSQEYDFAAADKLLRRGIELNPGNSLSRVWYSVFLTAQQKPDQAVVEAARAVELNPISPFEQQHHAWILYHARRFDEALARSSKTAQTDAYFSHVRGVHSWILRHVGRLEESISHAEAAVELSNASPWLIGNLAASYAKAGHRERAQKILRELEIAAGERYVSPYAMAIAYYFLDEIDKVFDCLEKSYAARDVWLIWLGTEPQLDSLRQEVRFQDLLRQINSPKF